ncbi:alpha/beta hydrolase [Myxococcota bacterium]|nr:alpha/beta hydrolase [Myxococcota bacterium]
MFESLRLAALGGLLKLPPSIQRTLSGPPSTDDGVALDPQHHWLTYLASRFQADDTPPPHKIPHQRHEHEIAAAFLSGPRPTSVRVEERFVPLEQRTLAMRIYRPQHHDGTALFYLHGGGFVMGSIVGQDGVCARIAEKARCTVISCSYRLAPEHLFPAAHADAAEAYAWIVANAEEIGIDRSRLGIGGDSAGGNLAASVVNTRRKQNLPLPKVQMLLYPVADATKEALSYGLFGEGSFLSQKRMRWFFDQYIPERAQRTDPRISILLEPDLSGVSPALIATAGFDVLRDEGIAYTQRLQTSGVSVHHLHFPHLTHGSFNFAGRLPAAAQALDRVSQTLCDLFTA